MLVHKHCGPAFTRPHFLTSRCNPNARWRIIGPIDAIRERRKIAAISERFPLHMRSASLLSDSAAGLSWRRHARQRRFTSVAIGVASALACGQWARADGTFIGAQVSGTQTRAWTFPTDPGL